MSSSHETPPPVPPDPEPRTDPAGPRANDPGTHPETPTPSLDARSRSLRIGSLALAGGLIGGLLAWLLGEVAIALIQPETEMLSAMGVMVETVSRKGEIQANASKAHSSFALLGALLGLSLGLAGGLARQSARQGMIAGLTGLVIGALVGGAASMALVPVYQSHRDADPLSTDLTVPLIVHGGIWSLIGAVGGLAFGLGLGGGKGQILNAVVGGLIGACVGTFAFELIGAFAFPLDKTHMPVSNSMTSRLVARMLVSVLASAGIAAMLTRDARPRAAPNTP